MDPSLVGSQMSSDAMSEQSLVREGAGYDEAFGSGVKLEDFSPSSGRETSAQSLDGEDECYAEDLEIEVRKESWIDGGDAPDGEENDGDESDDEEGSSEGDSAGPGDNRPFILTTKWAVNKFLPSMSDKNFSELRVRY